MKVSIVGPWTWLPEQERPPFDDPRWEIWTLNQIKVPRETRRFDMHELCAQSYDDIAFLNARPSGVPIYMPEHYPSIPASIPYPLKEVLTGVAGAIDYFAVSYAYQIALALLEDAQAIALYGVQLHRGTARERLVERACLAYWIGLARGSGVTVDVHPVDSGLLRHEPRYGYRYDEEKRRVEEAVDAEVVLGLGDRLSRERACGYADIALAVGLQAWELVER